ncbi:neprilysin-2-like [Aphidius gifuensis]|uniref:neprilysin-2-like n=1 Tax=Aphidius gifuensis TaxID=684658 RepID=UPI001CDD308D|nr:neprilysin-2-like [Aphidius gifuensis]
MKKPISVIFLLVFLLSSCVFGNQTFSTGNNVSDTCQTPVCHNVASRLLHDMDPSVNPCDDFYKFTCGGYLNSTLLINNLHHTSKSTELKTSLARTLYNTCKNKKGTIWKFMKAIEHWPVLKGSKWNESTFDFRKSMFKVGNTTQWKNYLFRLYYTYGRSIAVEPYPTGLSPEDLVQGLNNTKVNEYYNSMINLAKKNNVSIHNTNYEDDLKKILDFEIELARARLLPLQNLNSTSNEVRMTLVISYIVLQSDFFDIEQPNYMNYGALGTTIGHEMTHGLDIKGINYDANGRWNDSQWTSFSKNNFHNKSKCIIEQYNNFTVPEVGLNVNGTITQGETVADNSGIKAAYRAYKELLNNDKKLPGLEYTPEQLFWISFANSRCEINSNELLRNKYLSDVHPPIKFRVIGALSNMPEFAKDFNCPSGSNMNPTKKCSVW